MTEKHTGCLYRDHKYRVFIINIIIIVHTSTGVVYDLQLSFEKKAATFSAKKLFGKTPLRVALNNEIVLRL